MAEIQTNAEAWRNTHAQRRSPLIRALEPRMMFDAAAVETAVAVQAQAEPTAEPDVVEAESPAPVPVTAPATSSTDTDPPADEAAAMDEADAADESAPLAESGEQSPDASLTDDEQTASEAAADDASDLGDTETSLEASPEDADEEASEIPETLTSAVPGQEVVFVVDNLPDVDTLTGGVREGVEVVMLDSEGDGLAQMADYLDGRTGLSAIHIVSHGDEGRVSLGNTWLDAQGVAEREGLLQQIGQSLTEDGDILLYGCYVGADGQGAEFIDALAEATGADVAASADWTGDPNKDGDWVLEANTGSIESDVLFADAGYAHVLNTINAGDMVVLGWNATNDTITLAALVDMPAGTVIKITDKGWDQATNAFTTGTTGDGVVTWTASGAISAGHVFTLYLAGSDGTTTLTNVTTNANLTADIVVTGFTVTDPMNIAGDGIFIYQDTDANPYFVFGMNNSAGTVDANGWNTSVAITLRDSMLPNGSGSQNALTNGNDGVGLPGGASQQDNVQYTGPTTAADRETWLARIADSANWSGDSTGATDSSVGTAPGSQLSMTAPNAAPALGNLSGDTVSFTEGGSPVILDAGSNAAVTDADSADFSDGNVTVSIIANEVGAEDVLAIRNQGTGAGQIGVSGSNVTYGGTVIGTFSGGSSGNDLVIALNANASTEAAQALVRNISYSNSNNSDPSTAERTVRITVSDGDGGTSSNADVTVGVTGVNDTPTLDNSIADQNATEGAAFNFQFAANTFNDLDGDTLTYNAQLAGGGALPAWLSFNSGTRTFSGTPTGADVGTLSIELTANDGNGGTVAEIFDIVVANTNDAPTVANPISNQNATEDLSFSFTFSADTFADMDAGDTLTYTAQLAGGGAVPAWLNFDPLTRTFSGTPANGDVGTVSIDVTASDGNGGTVTDTFNIVVANTNDAPTLANAIPNQNANEDTAFNFQFAANTFNDVDAGDTLTYSAQLAGGGALPAWLSFNSGTRTFSGTPAGADAGTLSITVTAEDGDGATVTDTFNIVVTAVNDAPVVTAPLSIAVFEDVPEALTAISFTDADAGSSTVTATFSVDSGTLAATSGSGVTVSGSGTGNLSLSGSITDINSFISASGVSFTTASNSTADVTLTVGINDGGNSGSGGALTDSAIVILEVTMENDAPVNGVPGAQTVDQDSTLVFSSGNGNLISVSDVDVGGNTLEVTLTASNGLITLSGTTGLSFSTGSGTGNATMTFTGSVADVNNALNGLTFSPTPGYNGAASLQITTSDQGFSGSGSVQTDTDSIAINVAGTGPTATIVVSDTALRAGETATATITFSEAVTGVTLADFTVANGSLSNLFTADNITYTATLTPSVNVADATNLITLDNTGVQDTNGNAGSGTTDSNNYAIDTQRPTASIVVSDTALAAGETTGVTITFSEAVAGLDLADFSVANGSLSGLSSGDGGITWTAVLTPTTSIEYASNLITLDNTGYIDAAGNAGSGTTDSNNYAIDTQAPAGVSFSVQGSPASDASSVTFVLRLTEPVSGLDLGDFQLALTGSATGTLTDVQPQDALTYLITVSGISGQGSLGVALSATGSGVQDTAGNPMVTDVVSGTHAVAPVPVPGPAPAPAPSPAPEPAPAPTPPAPAPAPPVAAPPNPVPTPPVAPSLPLAPLPLVPGGVGMPAFEPTPLIVSDALNTWSDSGSATVSPLSGLTSAGISAVLGSSSLDSMSSAGWGGGESMRPAPFLVADSIAAASASMPSMGEQDTVELRPGQPVDYTVPLGTLMGDDLMGRSSMLVEIRQVDGRPLPSWLRFDPVTGKFSGVPPAGFSGSLRLELSVQDGQGERRTMMLEFEIRGGRADERGDAGPDDGRAMPAEQWLSLQAQWSSHGRVALAAQAHALVAALQATSSTS